MRPLLASARRALRLAVATTIEPGALTAALAGMLLMTATTTAAALPLLSTATTSATAATSTMRLANREFRKRACDDRLAFGPRQCGANQRATHRTLVTHHDRRRVVLELMNVVRLGRWRR